MQYARFEKLVLLVGGAAIIGALALTLTDGLPEVVELAAQGMLLLVLVAAARFGRRGGLAAAIIASAIYVIMRIPTLVADSTSTAIALVLASRLAAFGLVGIVGGELCARMRYMLIGLEDGSSIDDWSRVFNQRHAHRELVQARNRFARYNEDFSVVLVSLSRSLFAGLRPARQRTLVRAAADLIRNDVRLVDEVARLSDGRFLILLPHTARAGAEVVSSRVAAGLRKTLGASDESVRVHAYSATGELAHIDGLIETLEADEVQEEASGSYRDAAESTSNPAETSTASASASSTLSMSTAAVPDGSTKQ